LCRRAYTYRSQPSKPEKPAAGDAEASTEAKVESSASSDGTTEKTSSSSGHHHSVTKQLPLETWLSMSPYGSSRLSPLTLWINLQHLGK